MTTTPLTVQIEDSDFIRRAERLAIKKGRKDTVTFIKELFVTAGRRAVGLDADLTPCEVAIQLNCHVNTVKNYHKAGKFKHAYYRTSGKLLIPQRDVDALKNNTVKVG